MAKVTNPKMLAKIGGVIDIQGFYVEGQFVPRQLAIITKDTVTKVIEFDTGVDMKALTAEDRRTVRYIQGRVHYLDLKPSIYTPNVHPAEACIDVLQEIISDYDLTSDRPLALNNSQAETLFKTAEFPYVDIQTLIPSIPNTQMLMRRYSRGRTTFSTAGKVGALWKYIQDRQVECIICSIE